MVCLYLLFYFNYIYNIYGLETEVAYSLSYIDNFIIIVALNLANPIAKG
jgi:hypothetical protein